MQQVIFEKGDPLLQDRKELPWQEYHATSITWSM